jgi:hypothetical protein
MRSYLKIDQTIFRRKLLMTNPFLIRAIRVISGYTLDVAADYANCADFYFDSYDAITFF